MSSDIAKYIVNMVEQQHADELASLKAMTLRTVCIKVNAAVNAGDDDDDDGDIRTFESSATIALYQTAAAAAGEESPTPWVYEYLGAQLPVAALPQPATTDFVVQCAVEKIKLAIQDWLVQEQLDDLETDIELEGSVGLCLGQTPWCVFKQTQYYSDTQVDTWAVPVNAYLTGKAKQLLDVAQHVIHQQQAA